MNANRVMGIVYCREVLNTPRWWDNPVITIQEGDSMISRLRGGGLRNCGVGPFMWYSAPGMGGIFVQYSTSGGLIPGLSLTLSSMFPRTDRHVLKREL